MPVPRKVMARCPHCHGSGKVETTGVYRETLDLLAQQKDELNGAALAHLAGCKPTAMNNRLVALERLGLAARRPYGRQRLWRAVRL